MRRFILFFLTFLIVISTFSCGNTCSHKVTENYIDKQATCSETGEILNICTKCQRIVSKSVIPKTSHKFIETVSYITYKQRNDNKAVFYKSCENCKEISDQIFELEITTANEFIPHSLTVSMFDTGDKLSYGFNWNYDEKPIAPVIAIKKVSDNEWSYFDANVISEYTYSEFEDYEIPVYICKVEVELEPNTDYEYKIIECVSADESSTYSFTSVDPCKKEFTFTSFSDSQNGTENGALLNEILKNASGEFYLHGGDICESGIFEDNWRKMLDANVQYFSCECFTITN